MSTGKNDNQVILLYVRNFTFSQPQLQTKDVYSTVKMYPYVSYI